MKFGNFLFPESPGPDADGRILDETVREAVRCDALGMDAVWLAEHHFDGTCAYVDPVTFSAALATATRRITIGYAVAQASLHHPIRLAEQIALVDQLAKGRLIVGLGRGTTFNIYEYQGYGIDAEEAQGRYEEIASILQQAWRGEPFEHRGRHWTLNVPLLRPQPFSRPPRLFRAVSSEGSVARAAAAGEPFLMNAQPVGTIRRWIDDYRSGMAAAGFPEEAIRRNVADIWVWRNCHVAETDAEAERVGRAAFDAMQEHRAAMRARVHGAQGVRMRPDRTERGHELLCGAPATVVEALAEIKAAGAGGVIMQFRLGPMPHETALASIETFMRHVAPELAAGKAA